MKPSDELYKLIKSLSKAEKIYFKKFSKRHVIGQQNKYVKLFDMIEKQKGAYNEDEIIDSFRGDKFVNQIHVAKNYLFGLLLKALADFYSDKDTNFNLYDYLKKIRILIDKSMVKSAAKLIYKAKVIAKHSHNDEALYKLLEIESSLAAKDYTVESQKQLEKINELKSESLKQIQNTSIYRSINYVLNLITARWSYGRNPEDIKKIKSILNDPLIKNEKNAVGYTSKYELYSMKAHIYRFLLDDANSLSYRKRIIDLMEKYPETIRKNPEQYIAKLHNFINYALGTEMGVAKGYPIKDYLKKMKKHMEAVIASRKSPGVKSMSWFYYYQMQIGYYYATVNKDGFNNTLQQITAGIGIFKDSVSTRFLLNMYYYCSFMNFEFESYDESLRWLTLFINHKNAAHNEEIYHTLMIFSIILHYELGNYELADSLINNTKRYYRKEAKLYESEKVLLQFLRRLLSTNDKKDIKNIFGQLKIELAVLSSKDSEKRFLNAFDFGRWVDKKLGLV